MNYSFSIEHAKQYGVDEAIMLHNFIFWITQNLANNKHQHDGRTWTYNTQNAFTRLFPFWSRDQVKRVLNSLINQGVLVTENYNKLSFDKTLWYAFKNENLFIGDFKKTASSPIKSTIGQNHPIEREVSPNRVGEITQPIPDSKPVKKLDLKNNNAPELIAELSSVVVVELEKTFSSEELPAAKKMTASLPAQIQLEVLAVLIAATHGKTIKSKIAYLSGIVSRVQDGTFTPLPAEVKPVSSAERIEKEKIKQAESENRGKVDNVRYFADLYKKCGAVAAIPAQYLQAVREQLAGQGIVLNGC